MQNDARDTRAAVDATLERKSGVGLPPPDAGRRGRLRPSPPRESAARFSWDASMRRASLAHDHFASGRAPSSRRMSLASFVSRRTKARLSSKRKVEVRGRGRRKILDFENEIVINILVNFENESRI